MAVGRIYEVGLVAPPVTSKGRVYQVGLTGTVPTGSKGRIYQASLVGTPPAGSKGRILQVGLSGAVALVVAPILPRTNLEPLRNVDVTASLTQGAALDWVWRVVSAPAGVTVTLTGTGQSRTFRTPGLVAGGTVVLGVRAVNGTSSSPEMTVSFTVLPQIEWVRFNDGAGWRPSH